MLTIHWYQLNPVGTTELAVGEEHKVLSVSMRQGVPVVYVLHNSDTPRTNKASVRGCLTGEDIDYVGRFLGTLESQGFGLHYFMES